MEIKREMQISAPDLYNKLIDSALHDIQRHTGKKPFRKNLKNFSYVKTYSKQTQAKVKIDEIIENKVYQFTTSTNRNKFSVRYELVPLTDQTCELIYTEKMESYGFLQSMNDAIVGGLLGFFKKRRFKKMLKMMEEQ